MIRFIAACAQLAITPMQPRENVQKAVDNHVYLLAGNMVGPDAGNNYYFGHPLIVSPIA